MVDPSYRHKVEIYFLKAERINTLDILEKKFKDYRIAEVGIYGKLGKLTLMFHRYRDSLRCEDMFKNEAIDKIFVTQDLTVESSLEFDNGDLWE